MPTSCGPGLHSRFSVAVTQVGLDQHSYSTLGPVSAWVGDRLWMGKPPRCRTRHPGLLSLSPPSVVRLKWLPGGVNRHNAWYTSPYLWSCSVGWCLAEVLGNGDQRRRTGSGSALEALCGDALYKYTFTLLTLLDYQLLFGIWLTSCCWWWR